MIEIIFLEKCSHLVCKECLVESIKLSYPDSKCPCGDCEQALFDFEVRTALGSETYEELQS